MAVCVPAQNMFVSSDAAGNCKISEISPGGTVSTFFNGFGATFPGPMAFNSAGDLFVTATDGDIHEITPGGVESTFATGLGTIGGLAFNSSGDLFVSSTILVNGRLSGQIVDITPGGAESTYAAGLSAGGLAFDSAGDLFVSTGTNITKFTSNGPINNFSTGLAGSFGALAFNNAGDLFAWYAPANQSGPPAIAEITPNGTSSVFAPAPDQVKQMAFNSQGILFVANVTGADVLEFNSSGTQSTFVSGLGPLEGLAFAVPEPPVFGLLCAGVTALFLRRRRIR
jgi:hypothetical protein